MSNGTYSGLYPFGINLNRSFTTVTITGSATITNTASNYAAVSGNALTWTINNAGTIGGGGPDPTPPAYSVNGVDGGIGITLAGTGSITNTGSINGGTGQGARGGKYAENYHAGLGGDAVRVYGTNSYLNNAGGTIVGGRGGDGAYYTAGSQDSPTGGHGGEGGEGGTGVFMDRSFSSFVNTGSIIGGAGGDGGASNSLGGGSGGLGGTGILIGQSSTLSNLGTIVGGAGGGAGGGTAPGPSGEAGIGVLADTDGISYIINGASGQNSALIEGYHGVNGNANVTNFGTIASVYGTTGTAVHLATSSDVLKIEGGSILIGTATGAGGTLILDNADGAGTLSGLGTTIVNFGQYDVFGTWTLSGNNTLLNHTTLVNAGTLFIAGNLVVDPSTLINSSYMSGSIRLDSGSYLQNTATGTLVAAGTAVYGYGGPVTVTNSGLIQGTGAVGVVLSQGGTVTNATGGTIAGGAVGIQVFGDNGTIANAGTVAATGTAIVVSGGITSIVNSGTISGGTAAAVAVGTAGTLVNSGLVENSVVNHAGVYFNSGGTISNSAGGVILGGIYIAGTAGTVTNLGSIVATRDLSNLAVALGAGGRVDNNAVGALIAGAAYGVKISGGTGIFTNLGTVSAGNYGVGVFLASGGRIVNSGGGLIDAAKTGAEIALAAGYIGNFGTIAGGGAYLVAGGTVSNAGTGIINGSDIAVGINQGTGTVINAGTIAATNAGGIGVLLVTGGTVTNFGTISGTSDGIKLTSGGTVLNGTGNAVAQIIGSGYQGIEAVSASASIVNYGTVAGASGIYLKAGGYVLNRTGGLIEGQQSNGSGVGVSHAAGTIVNYGTILGQGPLAAGVCLLDGGSINNSGTIAGYYNGVQVYNATGFVNNTGTIFTSGTARAAVVGSNAGAVVTVVNSGKVFGGSGIYLKYGGALTNTIAGFIQGTVTSGTGVGIKGTAGTIINSGTIANGGPGGYAALLDQGGLIVNRGLVTGTAGDVVVVAGAPGTISNYGTLLGAGASGDGIRLQGSGVVTNFGTGLIAGPDKGVAIQGAPGALHNYGRISGGQGVYSNQAATIVNAATTASITGTQEGIRIEGTSATIINFGSVTASGAASDAIFMISGGAVTNEIAGYISGAGFGVYISGLAGTLVNLGTVTVGPSGYDVVILGAGGTVLNSGKIVGTNATGVKLSSGGTLVNSAGGSIQAGAGATGVDAAGPNALVLNYGTVIGGGYSAVGMSGPNQTLINSGLISNTAASNNGVFTNGGNVTNAAVGTITGYTGIANAQTAATIVNLGKISGTSATGVSLYGGLLVNSGGALIAGGYSGVIVSESGTVINDGTIGGTSGTGVRLLSAGSVINTGTISGKTGVYLNGGVADIDQLSNTGTIIGIDQGVLMRPGHQTVVNSGRISATAVTTGDGIYGIGGNVTNAAGGVISSTDRGVAIGQSSGTIVNVGTIVGYRAVPGAGTAGYGLTLQGGLLVNSAGALISGGSGGADLAEVGTVFNGGTIVGASALQMQVGGLLNNSGYISGLIGVYVAADAANAQITNTGTVVGGASGLKLHAAVQTVVNSGLVSATGGTGIGIEIFGGVITNASTGFIGGSGGGIVDNYRSASIFNFGTIDPAGNIPALSLYAGGTVTNAGTIVGGSGPAIQFSGSGNRLILDPDEVISGAVTNATTAGITLELASGGSTGTFNGALGTNFTGFDQLVVDPNAKWLLTGANTLLGTATIGSGAVLTESNNPLIISGPVVNQGTLQVSGGGSITIASGSLSNLGGTLGDLSGIITLGAGVTATGYGEFYGSIVNQGVIQAAGGTLEIVGTLTGGGSEQVRSNGVLKLASNTVVPGTLSFVGGGGTIQIDGTVMPANTIGGFGVGDTIDLRSLGFDSSTHVTFNNGTLTATSATVTDTLLLSGITPTVRLRGVSDAHGGTKIVTAPAGTYSGTYYFGINLGTSPATVTQTGAVFNGSAGYRDGAGIYGDGATAWNLINFGTVNATQASAAGIYFRAGGVVSNGSAGFSAAIVQGGSAGIEISGAAGTVVNYATIKGGAQGIDGALSGRLTVNNFGTIQATATTFGGAGLYMSAGGLVTNQATGVITGYDVAVAATGTAISVVNSGIISAGGLSGAGVVLHTGGTVTNTGVITAGGDGVLMSGAVNAVINAGTIIGGATGAPDTAILLYGGTATVTNAAGGVVDGRFDGIHLAAFGTVDNTGTIIGETNGFGIQLGGGGYVLNRAGGRIVDAAGAAVLAFGTGTIVNSGFISGGGASAPYGGVVLEGGNGVVSNEAPGAIYGYADGVIAIYGGAITLANAGTIRATGTASIGASLQHGGTVNNTGIIAGGADGILVTSAAGTVFNSGSITQSAAGVGAGVKMGAGGYILNGAPGGTASITGALAVAIHGTQGSIVNYGAIRGIGAANVGAYLQSGGGVVNKAGGLIVGGGAAVEIAGTSGSVVNRGTLLGTAGRGVYLLQGGSVANQGAGLISSTLNGVVVKNAAGQVNNSGTILAAGSLSFGVTLQAGGIVSNTGTITGGAGGVQITGATGTVVNAAVISATNTTTGTGIAMTAGGTLANAATGQIAGFSNGVLITGGAASVSNLGTIASTGTGNGATVQFGTSGVLVNGSAGLTSALITGYHRGVNQAKIAGAVGTVINYGTIQATQTGAATVANFSFGVFLNSGLVNNLGTIRSNASAYGIAVQLQNGGIVTNGATNATGTLLKASSNGILIAASAGTVINFGSIIGDGLTGAGVNLDAGGILVNGTAGSTNAFISGGATAVAVHAAAGTVVNYGTIAGGGQNAVYLANGGSVLNAGKLTASGSVLLAKGSAASLTNTGTISTIGTGGFGASLQAGGMVVNTGKLSGGIDGILISGGAGTVLNTGTIAATIGTTGIGVALQAGGQVVNNGAGEISGNTAGVSLGGAVAGTLTNSGTINGTGANGSAVNFGTAGGTLVNGATNATQALIAGYHIGVAQFSPGAGPGMASIVNYGTIERTGLGSTGYAIQGGSNTALMVINAGTIEQVNTNGGSAILLNSGTVANRPGGVIDGAGGNAIGVSPSTGVNATVTNFGTIRNETTAHSNVYFGRGTGLVDNGAGGIILSPRTAIAFGTGASAGAVVNAGTIAATGTAAGSGVYLGNGGVLTNQTTGIILANRTAVDIAGASGTVKNFGTIEHTGTTGTSGDAVVFKAGGRLTNYQLITGAHVSVYGAPNTIGAVVEFSNVAGTVVNLGTILSTASDSHGVELLAGGTIVNGATDNTSALIAAGRRGIYAGGTFGTPTPGALTFVYNYGTIANTNTTAADIQLAAGGAVTNRGLIAGARTGINFSNTAGTVVNFGTIASTAPTTFTAGSGVYLQVGGQITNQANAIITATRVGISIGNTTTTAGSVTIANAGTIFGTAGIAFGAYDTGAAIISNSGIIIGNTGNAVKLGLGTSTLTNTGIIAGNVGVQTETIATNAVTIANYGTINGSSGVAVFLGGGIDELIVGAGSVLLGAVKGIQFGDALDFRGIAGATGSIGANNLLTVSGGGVSATLQLDPSQDFTSDTFSAGADGVGGTLLTLSGPNVVLPGHTLHVTATLSGVTVLSGGVLEVDQGGTVINAAINNGGLEIVDFGGTDISGMISSGGSEDVSGVAIGTLLLSGGSMTVEPTGLTQGVVLDDAAVQIVSGVAIGTQISATDAQFVVSGGLATATVVSSGGIQLMQAGGVASATEILSSGVAVVQSGGTAIDTVIDGGIVDLNAGAATSGQILFTPAGGNLIIRGTVAPQAVIGGLSRAAEIDLNSISPNAVSAPVFDSTAQTVTIVSGTVSEVLHVEAVAADTEFGILPDGFGGTILHEIPPTPGNFGLTAASDSGATGDGITNVAAPVVSGTGEAGDTLTISITGGTTVSSTVGGDGSWSLQLPLLTDGTYGLTAIEADALGNASAAAALAVTIDTVAPTVTNDSLTVPVSAGISAMPVLAPTDPGSSASALKVLVTALPTDGTVTLAGDPVTLNENLTVTQLSSLSFAPNANAAGTQSAFSYAVSDVAGNTTAGQTTISVVPNAAPTLFDFVFIYNDGNDYYLGQVADDGTFGYALNQTKSAPLGQYMIYAASGPTTLANGSVEVLNYSHNSVGQGSPIPVKTAQGVTDGSSGLGSETDAVLGIDGQQHAFSPTQEAAFATTPFYGFTFTYADNNAFYSGTVADDGTFGTAVGTRTITGSSGQLLGTYMVFADGVSTRAAGTVVIDQFTVADNALVPNHASSLAVDGSSGLSSESGSFTVGGSTAGFSPFAEPSLSITIAAVATTPPPDQGTVVANEVAELYREVLGRDPDAGGLAAYTGAVESGMSLDAVRQSLATSAEAGLKLNQLYHQIFDRDMDPSGAGTYTQALENGETLAAVQSILAQSPEAQTDLNQLYLDVLNRNGDPGGMITYTGVLATGFTDLDGVRSIIAHSPEASMQLTDLFTTDIGRPPGAAELVGMENQLGANTGNGSSQATLDQALKSNGSAGGFTTVTPPAGAAGLTAQAGVPTLFAFDDMTFGNDTIAGFDPTRDTVRLSAATVPDIDTLVADAAAVGNDTVITFNGTQSITLSGVNPNNLGAGNFIIKPSGGGGLAG